MAEKKSKKTTDKKTEKIKSSSKQTVKKSTTSKTKAEKKQPSKKTTTSKTKAEKKQPSKKTTTRKTKAEKKQTSKKTTPANKPKTVTKRKRKASTETGPSLEERKQWQKLAKEYAGKKTPSYDMKKNYQDISAIKHNSFGLGFILAKYNNRLKVLFEEGTKVLISNYPN